MTFRVATPDDLDDCMAFERTRSREDLLWHIEAGLLFLAIDEDTIGYARLESFWKSMPYLALIVIREERRGRGVGTRLLHFVGDVLRSRGYTDLLSSSTATEVEPRRWHVRNGFTEIGELAGLNSSGEAEAFWRLAL